MKHLRRILAYSFTIAAAAVPVIIASPAVQHFLGQHGLDAGALVLSAAILRAIVKAVKERQAAWPGA